MGEAQELQLQIMGHEDKEAKSCESVDSTMTQKRNKYWWWIRISIYVILVLSGQVVGNLLGRLYFVKGGKSKWIATLVQIGGFPILIPYYLIIIKSKNPSANEPTIHIKPPSALTLSALYVALGLLAAATGFLYSIGIQNLPVSTYTLICASQLAFNSFFSFFLNSQKFTPFIVNSLVLLTISSILLVFNNESGGPTSISKTKYAIGFICTVGASAVYGLGLSSTQRAFKKIIKRETFKAVMDLIIFQGMVATAVILLGLFASGDWNSLANEMNEFQLGKLSYVMTVVWTAIIWQVYTIGCVGLIFEVSSLFANSISVLGLPIVPVLAVFVFHDKMDGLKAISLVLAIWGFLSYVYQQYLDRHNSEDEKKNANEVSKALRTAD